MKLKKLLFVFAFAALIVPALASLAFADGYQRPVPTKPLTFGSTVLGGASPVVCVPLTAMTKDTILEEAKVVAALKPDMIEVRSDFWDFIEDTNASIAMLRDINKIFGDTPILLTVRIKAERGYKEVSENAKFNFYKAAVKEKLADLIDMELAYGEEKIKAFKKELAGSGIALVCAYHDLNATPSAEEIAGIMQKEIAFGGDVAKIVVKPNKEEDVLTFLNGILSFRRANPEYPIIASGSGDIGRITRLIGGLFGIDLTFSAGIKGSNPTQMPVPVVRECLSVIYPQTAK